VLVGAALAHSSVVVLQGIAARCSVLQCVAACCSVLQCVAVTCEELGKLAVGAALVR